ncbi:small ubiquitin-like modifier 2 [Striga asiatica]|uniref:Small ubiquitin-like modifier 2 n=1 Tax=Striga asiatica TaxID=4170 RepID=A0A5A7Q9S8_STRAF|nr:small ubiquitin-like modifier 2 [Striga asiatica]
MAGTAQSGEERRSRKTPFNANPPKIAIYFKSQDGDVMGYRYERDKKMKYLLSYYCQEKSYDQNTVEFLFEGKRVTAANTPSQLEIKDNDEIEVMLHCSGGGFCSSNTLNH